MEKTEFCPICNSEIDAEGRSCPTCGYHFLGSTQQFKPVSVSAEEIKAETKTESTQAQLRVVRGPQIQAIFTLGDVPLTIGRSPQCEIFLNDMTVSREHARITPSASGHVIEDLQSYNGVWIDSENVEQGELKEGDIIQIGVFCLVYQKDGN